MTKQAESSNTMKLIWFQWLYCNMVKVSLNVSASTEWGPHRLHVGLQPQLETNEQQHWLSCAKLMQCCVAT